MKTIIISNMKGGVGKTTSTVNIGTGLTLKNKKVLLIDLDPQGNTSDFFLLENEENYSYIDEMLLGEIEPMIYPTKTENLYIIPARLELALAEKRLLLDTKANHNRLRKIVNTFKNDFDYIIVDCPPILNILIVNALNVADEVLIPYKIDKGAFKGYQITLENIKEIAESYDLDLNYSILFTAVNRNNTDKEQISLLREIEQERVLQNTIRNQAKPVTTASFEKNTVISSNSGVGDDYKKVVDELLERLS